MVIPPSAIHDRCPDHGMFSCAANSQSDTAHASVSLHDHSNRLCVATPTLVSTTATISCGIPTKATGSGQFVNGGSETHLSPKTSVTEPACIVVVESQLQRLQNYCQYPGTRALFKVSNCTFRQFSRLWLHGEQRNDLYSALTDCALFIYYLFDKGLQYSTITGYKFMIYKFILPLIDKHPIC